MRFRFWTFLEKANFKSEKEKRDKVLDLARLKLTASPDYDTRTYEPLRTKDDGNYGQLAVADVRLLFDYEPLREDSHDAQKALVASHMRLAYSVPSHLQYLRSGYSSEPILALVCFLRFSCSF